MNNMRTMRVVLERAAISFTSSDGASRCSRCHLTRDLCACKADTVCVDVVLRSHSAESLDEVSRRIKRYLDLDIGLSGSWVDGGTNRDGLYQLGIEAIAVAADVSQEVQS